MKRLVAALLAILTVGFPVGYLVLGQKGMVSFERKEVLLLYGALLAVLVAVSLLAVLLGRGHFDSRPRPARALGGAVKLCGVLALLWASPRCCCNLCRGTCLSGSWGTAYLAP